MNIFQQAYQDLADAVAEAEETITITPRNADAFSVKARIGSKTFKTYDGEVPVYANVRRFFVDVADLDGYVPKNGDSVGWNGLSFRMGNPDGGPPWRWHGSMNLAMSIYATEIKGS